MLEALVRVLGTQSLAKVALSRVLEHVSNECKLVARSRTVYVAGHSYIEKSANLKAP